MKEMYVQIFIPYETSFSLVLCEELLVEATLSTWNFGSNWPRLQVNKNDEFQPIFAHSASVVAPSEQVQLTLIGSPLYAFKRA